MESVMDIFVTERIESGDHIFCCGSNKHGEFVKFMSGYMLMNCINFAFPAVPVGKVYVLDPATTVKIGRWN
jgi:hypothetical protein